MSETDHGALMDRIYRYQRHIYDATRKYYLLGRDRLLDEMEIRPGDRVLEVGCGTARNLVLLAKRRPDAHLFGLDASEEMLLAARKKIARAGLDIPVVRCLAEEVDHAATFGLDRPFDVVFFSYALSMIPPWREALLAAARNVRPGGSIYVVDFWDQGDLPGWFRAVLTRWLALFHVRHEPHLLEYMEKTAAAGVWTLSLDAVAKRYAYVARLGDVDPETVATLRDAEPAVVG